MSGLDEHEAPSSPQGPENVARGRRRQALTLAVVVILAGASVMAGSTVVGALWEAFPYLVLLLVAKGAQTIHWAIALVVMLALTAFVYLTAGSSYGPSFALVWVVPVQVIIAMAGGWRYWADL